MSKPGSIRGVYCITPLKENVAHYKGEHTNVHCAMVDLSKVYERIYTSYLGEKLKATYLPGQIVNLFEYMAKTHLFALPMKDVLTMN